MVVALALLLLPLTASSVAEPSPVVFELIEKRCNKGWDPATGDYTGAIDVFQPVFFKLAFSGHDFGSQRNREFAVERCYATSAATATDRCDRVSKWFPNCGNSCGDADLALIYDGFIHFNYRVGTGITMLEMKIRDEHFEEIENKGGDASRLSFRLSEKVDGSLAEDRVGEWKVEKKMMAECRGELTTVTPTTVTPTTEEPTIIIITPTTTNTTGDGPGPGPGHGDGDGLGPGTIIAIVVAIIVAIVVITVVAVYCLKNRSF